MLGVVEVFQDNKWGMVCSNRSGDGADLKAKVLCASVYGIDYDGAKSVVIPLERYVHVSMLLAWGTTSMHLIIAYILMYGMWCGVLVWEVLVCDVGRECWLWCGGTGCGVGMLVVMWGCWL